jgi:hypothetical protein
VHPGSNAAKTSAEVRLGSIMAEPQLVWANFCDRDSFLTWNSISTEDH